MQEAGHRGEGKALHSLRAGARSIQGRGNAREEPSQVHGPYREPQAREGSVPPAGDTERRRKEGRRGPSFLQNQVDKNRTGRSWTPRLASTWAERQDLVVRPA